MYVCRNFNISYLRIVYKNEKQMHYVPSNLPSVIDRSNLSLRAAKRRGDKI